MMHDNTHVCDVCIGAAHSLLPGRAQTQRTKHENNHDVFGKYAIEACSHASDRWSNALNGAVQQAGDAMTSKIRYNSSACSA